MNLAGGRAVNVNLTGGGTVNLAGGRDVNVNLTGGGTVKLASGRLCGTDNCDTPKKNDKR